MGAENNTLANSNCKLPRMSKAPLDQFKVPVAILSYIVRVSISPARDLKNDSKIFESLGLLSFVSRCVTESLSLVQ